MINEAIVLAGGLGTRLRSSVPDLPKCMAPVAGIPFIDYVVEHFYTQGIERFIFALGYKNQVITQHLQSRQTGFTSEFSIENTPLGTGGAIRKACEKGTKQTILVINGDTFYKVNMQDLAQAHKKHSSECTLCLKPMHNFDRYGVVELDKEGFIESFQEKKQYPKGLINGGIYALEREKFLQMEYPDAFSFEKDYLERHAGGKRFFGHVDEGYFVDIGIPEDYERAQKEVPALV